MKIMLNCPQKSDNCLKFQFAGKYSRKSTFSKNQKKSACSRIEIKLEFKSQQEVQFPANPSHDINNLALKKKLKCEQVKS